MRFPKLPGEGEMPVDNVVHAHAFATLSHANQFDRESRQYLAVPETS